MGPVNGESSDPKIPAVQGESFVAGTGVRGLASAGGGKGNCAAGTQKEGPAAVLQQCFSNYKFDKNLIIGGRNWPSGTINPSEGGAAIRELKDGISRNPRLCRDNAAGCAKASPGAAAAADGKDMGADVDAVESAISGVE